MFGSHRIDALHGRQDAQLFTTGTYGEVFLLHIALRIQYEAGNLEVGEAKHFCFAQHIGRNVFYLIILRKFLLVVYDVLQLAQEPGINLGQLEDTVDGISLFQSLGNSKDTQVGGVRQFIIQVLEFHVFITHEAVHSLTNHTQTFLNDFFERATDGHNFTHGLHAGADFAADTYELRQVPTRNLANQVIQLRSGICRVGSSHLANLVERIAQSNLGSHECQRITGSLGSQCGRTGETCVHLDDTIVVCLGVERILDVTFTHDAQVADTFGGEFLQHFHLLVGQ